MAGSNNLYLEPIINGAVGDMSTNIAAMNTQLSETTRILMNILNNQGLTQNQTAYSGSAFKALTLSGDNTGHGYAEIYPDNAKYNAMIMTTLNKIWLYSSYTGVPNIQTIKYPKFDLNDVEKVQFIVYDTNNSPNTLVLGNQTLTFEDGSSISMTAKTDCVEADIPEVQRKKQDIFQGLETAINAASNKGVEVLPAKVYKNGAWETPKLYMWPGIGFTTSNLLAYKMNLRLCTQNGANESAFDKLYIPQTVYITIPDISGVASWVSLVLKGNFNGISVALVDNTSHDLIQVIETQTADISDVQQLSNLALMVTFAGDGNASQYMSGFAMRYY